MGKNKRIAELLQPTHNLAPLMRMASCADELCDMNIFVEVLTALEIASSVLQVFLLIFCLLESGSRVKRDRIFFFSRKKNSHHKCRDFLKILEILRKQKV